MDKNHVSKNTIDIGADPSSVWKVLTDPEEAKKYYFGAEVVTSWKEGESIVFKGSYNGNDYEEKGTLLSVKPNLRLQYTHWSNLENLPDLPENYRIWTFDLQEDGKNTQLTVTEDNIPTLQQKERSDEFWKDVLQKIKALSNAI